MSNPGYCWYREQPWKAIAHLAYNTAKFAVRVRNYCSRRAKGPGGRDLYLGL